MCNRDNLSSVQPANVITETMGLKPIGLQPKQDEREETRGKKVKKDDKEKKEKKETKDGKSKKEKKDNKETKDKSKVRVASAAVPQRPARPVRPLVLLKVEAKAKAKAVLSRRGTQTLKSLKRERKAQKIPGSVIVKEQAERIADMQQYKSKNQAWYHNYLVPMRKQMQSASQCQGGSSSSSRDLPDARTYVAAAQQASLKTPASRLGNPIQMSAATGGAQPKARPVGIFQRLGK